MVGNTKTMLTFLIAKTANENEITCLSDRQTQKVVLAKFGAIFWRAVRGYPSNAKGTFPFPQQLCLKGCRLPEAHRDSQRKISMAMKDWKQIRCRPIEGRH